MKIIETILEVFGWLIIVFGTTAAMALIAFLIYSKWTNDTCMVAALALIAIGFTAGTMWATKIWKRHGTIAWLSGIKKIS